MVWESSKMEQRYDAVLGVIRDGFTVTEVAQKFGEARVVRERATTAPRRNARSRCPLRLFESVKDVLDAVLRSRLLHLVMRRRWTETG